MVDGTRAGSVTALRSAKTTPSLTWSAISAAIRRLRRVFPAPPGPTRVTSRSRGEEIGDLGELLLPSDERGQRRREVGASTATQRPDGREIVGKAGDDHVIERTRLVEVLQDVTTQAPQGDTLGQYVLHEGSCCVRDQDLPPVPGGRDPRGPVDVDPYVVASRKRALARVEAHPDAELPTVWPRRFRQSALRRDRSAEPLDRGGERDEEGVALGPDLSAALGLQRPPDDLGVKLLDGSVAFAQLLQQPRGALDVGEHERYRSCWQVGQRSAPLGALRDCRSVPVTSASSSPLQGEGRGFELLSAHNKAPLHLSPRRMSQSVLLLVSPVGSRGRR